MTSQGLDFS